MKCKQPLAVITVHRPWGYAIAHLGKDIENRSWCPRIPVGSFLAIHNGMKWDADGEWLLRQNYGEKLPDRNSDPAGAIVAISQFDGCVREGESPWFAGPVGWKLKDVVAIEPVYCRGQQGLWFPSAKDLNTLRENYRQSKTSLAKV
ncbi:hypothetical protein C1752_12049 [Acaryochloris thomasi RCC1774]|uniref:ASCH domain-containing protein n=1 Tax=Acaryochloris thomasi RCC1774 TaxID=1764569 RepID=A0A2W1J8J8_9CYAN|nr:hypothetical protein [Acaryochloris thomasi]PZD70478.1 hypothetical protein C1752_12049 [Acaryochloris thomasi RCC1774]